MRSINIRGNNFFVYVYPANMLMN